ncbi:FAD-binding oxidoreductase [Pseudoflavonifractor sp. DSM 107456]|uniref:FAD-binding oxidoreductase n=2 Tax=Pseudoflavonifractor TaxID=1017280 RepID=A0ABR9RBI4_9FIRM|nr:MULTISPECIES: FAD-dependent oxidoreductase [Eubacteriales]MBC5731543.1 FAD-binding oxidoreductase [Pseudoflavonifractor hominis]MBE5056056.1 FAD-binding oxidoreductase [Pseudoflavonifractor gallinarum]MBS5134043.1 FAD-binding oxidoreductase [Oscillospiraceae bacterium]
MRNKYGAIVIGGGYFGCACSYFLAKAGVPTLLLEEKEISRGASGANFGNVQVQDASMGQSYELTLAGFARMKTMTEELGCDIGYQSYPSLIGAESEEHLPELERLFQEKKEAGLDVYWLEGDALQEAEPNLAPGTVLAASYFEQGRVYPFHYQYALVRQGRRYGLEVREFSTVSSLLVEGGVCTGVMLADGTTVRAEHVIVTSGAGTRPLCATAGLDVPVYSVKAEAFVTEAIQPFLKTYYSSAAFFAEAHNPEKAVTSLCIGQSHYGNILLAETTKPHTAVDEAGQDCTSMEHCRNIREKVLHFFPALEPVSILRGWVTASPYTPNNEPIFGKAPVPGLILAAGFKSSAVVSAVVGETVAELVTRDTCAWDLDQYTAAIRPL